MMITQCRILIPDHFNQVFVIATALHVLFQISMNARLRSLVTPTPTAPTLEVPTSVTARKGSRETARTVQVSLFLQFAQSSERSRFDKHIGLGENGIHSCPLISEWIEGMVTHTVR